MNNGNLGTHKKTAGVVYKEGLLALPFLLIIVVLYKNPKILDFICAPCSNPHKCLKCPPPALLPQGVSGSKNGPYHPTTPKPIRQLAQATGTNPRMLYSIEVNQTATLEVIMPKFYEEFVIAKSDEFTVVEDSSDFVHIMDGESVVRLTMSRETLNDIASQVIIWPRELTPEPSK